MSSGLFFNLKFSRTLQSLKMASASRQLGNKAPRTRQQIILVVIWVNVWLFEQLCFIHFYTLCSVPSVGGFLHSCSKNIRLWSESAVSCFIFTSVFISGWERFLFSFCSQPANDLRLNNHLQRSRQHFEATRMSDAAGNSNKSWWRTGTRSLQINEAWGN